MKTAAVRPAPAWGRCAEVDFGSRRPVFKVTDLAVFKVTDLAVFKVTDLAVFKVTDLAVFKVTDLAG